ncbi:unnamed protein product [Diamesa serratosioi]
MFFQNQNMEIKSVLMEFRPNLSSINCFILLSTDIDTRVKISVKPDGITIDNLDTSHKIETKKLFVIKNSSVFNFLVGNKFISFSFLNERSSNEELLQHNNNNKLNKSLCSELSLVSNEIYKVTCSNCSSNLLIDKNASFQRILELPMQFEMEDMFCHLHSNEDDEMNEEEPLPAVINDKYCHNDHGSGESVAHKFQPNIEDIFYAKFYILMNNSIFKRETMIQKDQSLHCKRCLHLIGELSSNKNSIKIWCENVHFDGNYFYKTINSINMVIDAIKSIIFSYNIMPAITTVKIILECVVPSTNKKHNLLLQVMDRNLKIFKMKSESLELEETKAMKVMYCASHEEQTFGYLNRKELFKSWSKDLNVNCSEISFEQFHNFYNYLSGNSALIPHLHRTNDLFNFSYIDL